MRLYLDASAILKAYLDEHETERALKAVRGADGICSSRVARAEVRGRLLQSGALAVLLEDFDELWGAATVIDLSDSLADRAATLVSTRRLRTLDAIHLASALEVADEDLVFATWDRRLWDAAVAEGLAVIPQRRP